MTDTSSPLIDCPEDRITISRLLSVVEGRFTEEQQSHVYHAYILAAEAHNGQERKSGEAYIFHPLATAYIVAKFELDCESIIAAILHDVLEDTDISREELVRQFGEPVTAIVDGLSKLTTIKFNSQAEKQAANFQKMLLAMVDDIRVILIKLADRLHNMQTLDAMAKDKRIRIARETLEIFVPIANRLGIYSIKNQLEDLGFKALHPFRYVVINNAIKNMHGRRKELIQKQEILFAARLEELGIEAKVRGREKHAYSVYQKMKVKQLPFSKVFDVYAIRVVVNSIDECYRALGVVHAFYSPVPKKFKDYIAVPKNNGYQSLHTLVVNNDGLLMEVQIRTHEMDKYAETGIASHWAYKEGEKNYTPTRAQQWLSNLIDLKEKTATNVEFLEQVKLDLFPHEIYVFSPKGDIYQLRHNATPVDFAYAVHSEVGDKCDGAIVNKQRVSL